METNHTELSKTTVGEMILNAMEDQGVSIKDLSEKVDITYEHVRRLVRGESVPSKYVLKEVCAALNLPYKQAERLSTADRIKKRFGGIPAEISGKKPSLEPIERVWDNLSEEQQQDAIQLVLGWAKRSRANKS